MQNQLSGEMVFAYKKRGESPLASWKILRTSMNTAFSRTYAKFYLFIIFFSAENANLTVLPRLYIIKKYIYIYTEFYKNEKCGKLKIGIKL